MDLKAIAQDKRVWVGAGALGAVVLGVMLFRKGSASGDSGNQDPFGGDLAYYSMPYQPAVGTTATGGSDTASISDILNYSGEQAKLASNQNLAGIASQFQQNLASILANATSPIAGAAGSFTVGGAPISFDFTFKDASAAIMGTKVGAPSSNSASTVVAASTKNSGYTGSPYAQHPLNG